MDAEERKRWRAELARRMPDPIDRFRCCVAVMLQVLPEGGRGPCPCCEGQMAAGERPRAFIGHSPPECAEFRAAAAESMWIQETIPRAVGGMGEPRPVNPPVPLHQRHDCGDPACDGEALTIGLKACTHGNVLYVMPTDPFHRCVLVADESSGDTAWCTACGAMRCNGRWLEPRWFSTMRPETAGSR